MVRIIYPSFFTLADTGKFIKLLLRKEATCTLLGKPLLCGSLEGVLGSSERLLLRVPYGPDRSF